MNTAHNGEMVLVAWSVLVVIVGRHGDIGPDTGDVDVLGKGDGAAGIDSHVARGHHTFRFRQAPYNEFTFVVYPDAATGGPALQVTHRGQQVPAGLTNVTTGKEPCQAGCYVGAVRLRMPVQDPPGTYDKRRVGLAGACLVEPEVPGCLDNV